MGRSTLEQAANSGTPAAPGLVATVVRDEDLVKLELQDKGYTGSCVGTAYRVADEDARQVLDDLDFREKGGYTREVVQVAHAGGTLGPKRSAKAWSCAAVSRARTRRERARPSPVPRRPAPAARRPAARHPPPTHPQARGSRS